MWENLLHCGHPDRLEARKGRILNLLLLIILSLTGVLLAVEYVITRAGGYLALLGLALGSFGGCYALSYRGAVRLASWATIAAIIGGVLVLDQLARSTQAGSLIEPLLLIAPVGLAAVLRSWREVVLLVGLNAAVALGLYLGDGTTFLRLVSSQPEMQGLFILLVLLIFVSTGFFAGATNWLMRSTLADLRQFDTDPRLQERQRVDLTARLITVQEEERKRIARDVHDGPVQDLTVLLLGLTELRNQVGADPQAAQETALRLRQEGRHVLDSLRALTNELRPAVLDDYGLAGALDYLARREQTFQVAVDCPGMTRLDPSVETVIFRLVQEALVNVRRHAHAQQVEIRLHRIAQGWALDVRDDGRGFDMAQARRQALISGHMGLASMAERVDLVGGALVIQSSPGHGTQIHAEIPVAR